MLAKDKFHEIVINALQQQGWTITHDPYHIDLGFVDFYINLGAERLIGATRDGEKIAVEIKTFLGASTISEFHTAIGQFIRPLAKKICVMLKDLLKFRSNFELLG